MNKAQLIDHLSDRLGGKRAAAEAVDAVLDTITRRVAAGERVALTGFGVFEKVARPARTGRNPRTGASVKIKKTTVPKFKAGQSFKDVVSGARKLPKGTLSAVRSVSRAAGSAATKQATPAAKKTTTRKTAATGAATTAAAKKTTARTTTTAKKASPAATRKVAATKAPAAKSTTSPAKAAAKKTTVRRAATKKA